MLFTSAQATKYTFDLAQRQAEVERKEDARKKLDFYYDEQLSYLYDRLAEHFSDPERFSLVSLNIVQKIIDGLSTVYIQPASRRVQGNSQDQNIFDRIAEQADLDIRMKQANRLSKLCGTVLIKPVFRQGQIALDLLTPDILDVETGSSPQDVQAVTIAYYPESGKQEELTYTRWTKDSIERLDYNKNLVSSQSNPYQTLPFVPIWSSLPVAEFWQTTGNSLIAAQEALNEKLTDLIYILRLQGFSVPSITGAGQEVGQLDPGSALNLPQDAEFDFKAPNSPIRETLDSIDYLVKTVAISYGLPASYLSNKPSERKSGISRLIENKELSEKRADDILLFSKYEKELFQKIKTIWNWHSQSKISADSELEINFADPQQASISEQAQSWALLMDYSVLSPVDVIQKMNPSMTEEEAIQKFQQNQNYSTPTQA